MEEEQPPSGGPTILKGCGLIVGGALLGFFGCLGALTMGNEGMLLVMLFLGLAVIIWGLATIVQAIQKSRSAPSRVIEPPGPSQKE